MLISNGVEGRKWHKDKKYWSFPDTDGKLEEILKSFEGEEVRVDSALQTELSRPVIARHPERSEGTPKQSPETIQIPSLAKRGEGRFSDKKPPSTDFDDLKRELVSRKYSYKTVKGYLYYNRDFLIFVDKKPSEINDSDIKDYLLYLAEEKQAATSTLNQAINPVRNLRYRLVRDLKRRGKIIC